MSRREPAFWYPKGRGFSLASLALLPAGFAFDWGGRVRRAVTVAKRTDVPVICVGNLVAGGVGKTPIALAVARRIADRGGNPFFLTRGYGGNAAGPRRVDAMSDTAREVGDEPLLLARRFPTIVSPDRPAGARLAVEEGADCIVMDDGFQNPSLKKDLSLVVVDGERGFGNGRIIPAGPLREHVAHGLRRADGVIIVGEDGGVHALIRQHLSEENVLTVGLHPVTEQPMDKKRRYLAFAGIGNPDRFFGTLRSYGVPLADQISFPDHHLYTEEELASLREKAVSSHAALITTEKDWQRLSEDARAQIWYLAIEATVNETDRLDALLDRILKR